MTDENHKISMQIQPPEWDNRPRIFMSEVREILKHLADEGTSIDSGGCSGGADLWIKSGGVEYFIQITLSSNQKAREKKS